MTHDTQIIDKEVFYDREVLKEHVEEIYVDKYVERVVSITFQMCLPCARCDLTSSGCAANAAKHGYGCLLCECT